MSNKQILGLLAGIIAGTAAKNVMASGSAAKKRKRSWSDYEFKPADKVVWDKGFHRIFKGLDYKDMTTCYFMDFMYKYFFTMSINRELKGAYSIPAFFTLKRNGDYFDDYRSEGIDPVFCSFLQMSLYIRWIRGRDFNITEDLRELLPLAHKTFATMDSDNRKAIVSHLDSYRSFLLSRIGSTVVKERVDGNPLKFMSQIFSMGSKKDYIVGMYEAYDNLSDYYSKCNFDGNEEDVVSGLDAELLKFVCLEISEGVPDITEDIDISFNENKSLSDYPIIREYLIKVFGRERFFIQMELLSKSNLSFNLSMKSMFKHIADDARNYFLRMSSNLPTAKPIHSTNSLTEVFAVDDLSYSFEYVEMLHFYYLVYTFKYESKDLNAEFESVSNLFLNKSISSAFLEDGPSFTQIVLEDKKNNPYISVIPAISGDINNRKFDAMDISRAFGLYGMVDSKSIGMYSNLNERTNIKTVEQPFSRFRDLVSNPGYLDSFIASKRHELWSRTKLHNLFMLYQSALMNGMDEDASYYHTLLKAYDDMAFVENMSTDNMMKEKLNNFSNRYEFDVSYYRRDVESKQFFIFSKPMVFERERTKELLDKMSSSRHGYTVNTDMLEFESLALYDSLFKDIFGVRMKYILGFSSVKKAIVPLKEFNKDMLSPKVNPKSSEKRVTLTHIINVCMEGENGKTYIFPIVFSAIGEGLYTADISKGTKFIKTIRSSTPSIGYGGQIYAEGSCKGAVMNSGGDSIRLFHAADMSSATTSAFPTPVVEIGMLWGLYSTLEYTIHSPNKYEATIGRICFPFETNSEEWNLKVKKLSRRREKREKREQDRLRRQKSRLQQQERAKAQRQRRQREKAEKQAQAQRQRIAEAQRLKAQQQVALQAARQAKRLEEQRLRLQQIARQEEAELQRMIAQQQRQAALEQQAALQQLQRQIDELEEKERIERQKARAAEQRARAQRQRMLQQEQRLLQQQYVQDVIEARTPVENPDFSFPQNVRIPSQYNVFSECLLGTVDNIQTILQPNMPWQWAVLCSMKELVVNLRMRSMEDGGRFDPNRVIQPWTFYQRIFSFESFIADVLSLAVEHNNTVDEFNCYWSELPNSCISLGIPLENESQMMAWFAAKHGNRDFRPEIYQNSKPILKCIFVGVVGDTQYTDFVVEIPHISINTSTGQKTFKRSCVSYRLIVSGRNGFGEWELDQLGFEQIDDVLRMELGAIWISLASIMRNRYLQRNIIVRPRVRNGNIEPDNPGPTGPVTPNNPQFVIRTKDIELARDQRGSPLGRLEVRNVYVPANAVADSDGKGIGPNWAPPEYKATTVAQDKLDKRLSERELAVFQDSNLRDNPYVLQWQAYRDEDGNVVRRQSDNQLVRVGGRGVKIYEPLSDYPPESLVEQQFYWNPEEGRPKYYFKAWKEVKGWARDENGQIVPFTFPYLSIIDVY